MLPLRSALLFTLTGRVSDTVDIGTSPLGHRRIIPVAGGEFEGPKLRGRVLPGGADGMLVDSEGVAHVDVRMALQTDDGEGIYMQYRGLRHGLPAVMARVERGEPPNVAVVRSPQENVSIAFDSSRNVEPARAS